MITINRSSLGALIRFGVVGTIATAIHYGLYWLLAHWIDYNAAYTVGYAVSFVLNFILSSVFTFRSRATVRRGVGFILAHFCNYLIQIVLLNLFIGLGVNEDLAPVPVFAISIPVNFLMVRFVFESKYFRA